MSQSLESSHSSLRKHNRKWDVCGKGSGEGAGVRTMECGSGLAPLLSTELHRRPRREGPVSQPHLIHQALKVLGDHRDQTSHLHLPCLYGETEERRCLPRVPNRACSRGRQLNSGTERGREETCEEDAGAGTGTGTLYRVNLQFILALDSHSSDSR